MISPAARAMMKSDEEQDIYPVTAAPWHRQGSPLQRGSSITGKQAARTAKQPARWSRVATTAGGLPNAATIS